MKTAVFSDVRTKTLRSNNRFWRPEDFSGSPEAVAKALSRLARSGHLRRVRRGLYWRGSPTRLGMAPPPPELLAEEVVDKWGIGPAGLSAALALGLSTQVPRLEAIAVPRRAPRNARGVRFVTRAASTGRRDEKLRPTEVALFEVLRDWENVEVPHRVAMRRIEGLAAAGAIRIDRLVRASATEPPRTRARFRSLLTALDRTEDARRVRPARSDLVDPTFALTT